MIPSINIPDGVSLHQRNTTGDEEMLAENEGEENLSSRENLNPDVFHRLHRPEQRGRRPRGASPRGDPTNFKQSSLSMEEVPHWTLVQDRSDAHKS